jgi:3-dehydroquinate dehydratase-2
MKVLVLHGPNLNALGHREPQLYGSSTLNEINHSMADLAVDLNVGLECFQSNHEGELIDKIQSTDADAMVFNPAGYTHTSISLRDAILSVSKPFVEVHMSNVYTREPFRHVSYFRDIAIGQITGFGAASYLLGLRAVVDWLKANGE